MKMEMMGVVDAQSPGLDLRKSNCSTPYISAPSTPQRPLNLCFYSAPTSPGTSSFLFGDDDDLDHVSLLSAASSMPFSWELSPGVPKSSSRNSKTSEYLVEEGQAEGGDEESFEFDFSGQLDKMVRPSLSSADELFDGGRIRALKPPPRLQNNHNKTPHSESPAAIKSKLKDAHHNHWLSSPRHSIRPPRYDPFEAAALNSQTDNGIDRGVDGRGRGRDRGRQVSSTNSSANIMSSNATTSLSMRRGNSRKGISRSLSPLRVSEFALLHHVQEQADGDDMKMSSSSSKKWRLKDLFLFRSASEGRAAYTSSVRKYFTASRRNSLNNKDADDNLKCDSKNSSFRSSTSGGGSVSTRRGQKGSASAHEMHYASKRAVAEELKKKTSLPYKHGLLACLGFSPLLHDLSKAFPS